LYDLGHFLSFGYAFYPDYWMRRVTYGENDRGKHNSGEPSSGDRQPLCHLESAGDDAVWRLTERC
jgi:hypothetical protein